MARVGEYLKAEPIAAIYSSPRARALESAGVLAEQMLAQDAGVPLPDGRGSEREKVLLPDGHGSEGEDVSTLHAGVRAPRADESTSVQVIADLREIDFGDFEGLAYDEIATRYPELYRQWMEAPTEVRFPNGESFCEMRSRVLEAFDAIEREWKDQTVAIISHGGVNRILIAWALQIPDKHLFRVAQDYAAVNLLTIEDGVPRVELMNHRLA
jgi:broad specificity phosphatase PhoE